MRSNTSAPLSAAAIAARKARNAAADHQHIRNLLRQTRRAKRDQVAAMGEGLEHREIKDRGTGMADQRTGCCLRNKYDVCSQ